MRSFSTPCFATLLGLALLSSCSRPVAYVQPGLRDPFTNQSQPVAPLALGEATKLNNVVLLASAGQVTTSKPVVQAPQAADQLEAYVRNDTRLRSNRKLTQRLVRIHEVINAANQQTLSSVPVAKMKRRTLAERVVLMKLDKRLKQQLAPAQPKATSSNLLLGAIIGVVGLILLLVGSGFLNVLGIIGLVVGVVLIVLSLLNS